MAAKQALTVLKDNKTALVVLIGGGVVLALYVADRSADVVDSTVDLAGDIVREITSTGLIGAAVLVAAFLLGAPAWIAFAATGVYLVTSAGGKLTAGILGRGPGGTGGGQSDREMLAVLCKAHGGPGTGILEAGGQKIGICADETIVRFLNP